MPLKNTYGTINESAGFSLDMLAPGEIAVEVRSMRERKAKEVPVIELGCKIIWTSLPENDEYVGEEFVNTLFFGPNSKVTIDILLNVFRNAGFNVTGWAKNPETPLDIMLPSSLRLIAWKQAVIAGKVTRSTNSEGQTRSFFNFSKILREVPGTGESYSDALPKPIPDELVLEAYHMDGAQFEADFNHGANASGKDNIPV